MKKTMKWLLISLLFFMSFFSDRAVHAEDNGSEETGNISEGIVIHVNPLYEDVITDEDISAFRKKVAEEYRAQSESTQADAPLYDNEETASAYVRSQMVGRKTTIEVRITSAVAEADPDYMSTVLEGAFEYTDSCTGQEGDALQWVIGMWHSSSSWSSTDRTLVYTISYYTDAAQEATLTSEVNSALAGLGLNGKTETQKIRLIHDYICNRVNYDYDHLGNQSYKLQYTAYAAMHNRTSVCQGYAVLFYRMCKDAGLSVRVVTGMNHAWNIVRIGSLYYNIDTTWDGQDDETYHTWYLKGMREFPDHFREEPYDADEFDDAFPMYLDPAMEEDNLSYTFNTVSGGTVNTSASGRRKMIVFGKYLSDYYSIDAAEKLANISSSAVDIYMVDTNNASKSALAAYADELNAGNLTFCYDTGSTAKNAMAAYMTAGGYEGQYYTHPMIVYIDMDNKYQSYFMGPANTGSIIASIAAYLHTEPGWQKANNKWYYYGEDGRMVKGWRLIDSKWYFFDTDGAMVTGWKLVSGKWYYFNTGGDMAVGWAKIKNVWYYFTDSGAMGVGWQMVNDKWYYFASSGAMVTGWQKLGNTWYYFNAGGDMAVGWAKINNVWYYFTDSGAMGIGWQLVNGKWYYFASSGAMVTGWQKFGSTWYYFNPGGDMATGLNAIGGAYYCFTENGNMVTGWYKIDETWYYFASSGRMTTGWLEINNTWYYFSSSGEMATGLIEIKNAWYYFTENGDMVTGWLELEEGRYYFQESGAMKIGWLKQNGYWYYFDTSGIMVTGTQIIGGVEYNFSDEGVCLNP